jgi:putative ABC transport system permease protein
MKSILGNKARSALTMLGIIIGVASVIILTGIGGGTTKEITDSISEMGVNRITVTMRRGNTSSRSIDLEDMEQYLEDNPETVSMMSPYLNGSVTVKNGTSNVTTSLDACGVDYETIGNLELSSGRFFNESDITNRKKVCIVGTYLMEELYGGVDPVGQNIKINGSIFEIIGMYEEEDDSTESSGDDKITIPYSTAMRFLKNKNISTYYFYAASEDVVETVTDDLKTYIANKLGTTDGFNVSNLTSMLETMNEMTATMTAMLAGIAGISLVVGGIGIMNIMTVSVSERTREIGIRKAIGARTTDILTQFLIESVVLSGMGGVVGIAFGLLAGIVCNALGLTYVTQVNMVILSFAFSLAVGVFFGLAPANKAAKLNPIEALRSD